MNKLTLKLCVLTVSLLVLAMGARPAAADPPPPAVAFEVVGMRVCLGDVEQPATCAIHVPRDHRAPEPADHRPSWSMIPLAGMALCFGDVPALIEPLCHVSVPPARARGS